MDDETLRRIASRAVEVSFEVAAVPARFEGVKATFDGTVTLHADADSISATLEESESYILEAAKDGPVEIDGGRIRDAIPGKLIGPESYGSISPAGDNGWFAARALYVGESFGLYSTYRFSVETLRMPGPANGSRTAATRLVFRGSEVSIESSLAGRRLVARRLTTDVPEIRDQLVAVAVDGALGEEEAEAIWNWLCFVSGNRVGSVLIEHYDDTGRLIETLHRRSKPSEGRNAPFSLTRGRLTSIGAALLLDGLLRLLRAPFPIEVILHHLTDSNSGNLDTDSQHLILGIHTAIEAWNRSFGFDLLADDRPWGGYIKRVRCEVLRPIYDDIGPELAANLASATRHANRTTTAWRQSRLFESLGIDISDEDNKRALAVRDEILHNGYFLLRYGDLSQDARQQRYDDIRRLRILLHCIIFRLTAYRGAYFDYFALAAASIEPVDLPAELAPPPDRADDAAAQP